VILAGVLGALAGLGGAVVSSLTPRLPTGPTIVLVMTAMVVVSLLLAPRRGLLAARLRTARQRRRARSETVLADLYRLARQHPDPVAAPHAVGVLQTMSAGPGVRRSLEDLAGQGLVAADPDGRWRLTEDGVARATELVGDRPDPPPGGFSLGARKPPEARS
jgi:manganese/zinc/iron transport system permease protein